ncbi:MAG: hypothetical protein ABI761_06720 [Saprospiraceae bacterium]
MKYIILLSVCLISFCDLLNAQAPQFAVVKPNGTTSIYPSWQSAYDAAVNDDYIYLPGGGINGSMTISKRLHIFGAGHHPDSTSATSKTIVVGEFFVNFGGSGGSVEGISLVNYFRIGTDNRKITNFLIKNCIGTGVLLGTSILDSLPEFITFSQNIFYSIVSQVSGGCKNLLIEKNIISGQVINFQYCSFKNNVLLLNGNSASGVSNSIFENNIFLYSNPVSYANNNCFNSFYNNLKIEIPSFASPSGSCPVLSETGNISVPLFSDIFISYDGNGFDYSDNYHLKPTCPGVGAGTDGTDVGIYGTIQPTSEGWVPSNPHIYFKDIDSNTGPDGKLHIQVGVRTNN